MGLSKAQTRIPWREIIKQHAPNSVAESEPLTSETISIGEAADKSAYNVESKTTAAESEPEPQGEPESTEEPEEESKNIFYPGDVIETKNVRLSYISCGEYTDSNMFIEPAEGYKFVSFEFEFENISSSDTSVGSFDFNCYVDGYEASQAFITSDDALISITSLSPGRKARGIVVFEVPEDAVEIEVEYETSFWTSDKAIFMYQ